MKIWIQSLLRSRQEPNSAFCVLLNACGTGLQIILLFVLMYVVFSYLKSSGF
jgi:hypothetical protein